MLRQALERRGWTKVGTSETVVPTVSTWAHQWHETLRMLDIDLAFDVGANVGQWYQRFRAAGFGCPVVSFEPDPRALVELGKLAAEVGDPSWTIQPVALGRTTTEDTLYLWPLISGSTSLKPVSAFGADFTGYTNDQLDRTTIPVRRFDELYGPEALAGHRSLLKIDVQGYEREVLGGMAPDVIGAFAAIEIEIPLVEVYAGSASFMEIFSSISDAGFVPYTIQSERWHGEGYGVADCDVLFVNVRAR